MTVVIENSTCYHDADNSKFKDEKFASDLLCHPAMVASEA
jgi:hypothetical protein